MLRPETDIPLPLSEFVVPEHEPRLTIQEQFDRMHAANPWIAPTLIALIDEARANGETCVGIKAFWERLRWAHARSVHGGRPKLNNNLTSRYARHIIAARPDLAPMIRVRELRAA